MGSKEKSKIITDDVKRKYHLQDEGKTRCCRSGGYLYTGVSENETLLYSRRSNRAEHIAVWGAVFQNPFPVARRE